MDTSNEVKQDIKILTYFKMKNNMNSETEYILYNYETNPSTIYVSSVFHDGETLKLIKPTPESLSELKRVIQNLISVNPNSFIFSQNKYQYIDINNFKDKQIEKDESQRIQLNDEQYKNLINSNYLMYPYTNMSNAKAPEGFKGKYSALADTISIVVSSVLLLLILGGLIAYQFDWNMLKAGVFDFDGIMQDIMSFDLYIHNYLILKLALASFIFALISYKSEKSHPGIMWASLTLIFILIFIAWALAKKYVSVTDGFEEFLKVIAVYSVCASIIFTIPYVLCKEVTSLITNAFSFCNFVTYYTIYFLLFTFIYIGLGLFYNNYLLEHVIDFIAKII